MATTGTYWLWGYLEGRDGKRRAPRLMLISDRYAYDTGKQAAANELRAVKPSFLSAAAYRVAGHRV